LTPVSASNILSCERETLTQMQAAARTMGLQLFTVNASKESDISIAFAAVV
jgi:hypothetical protein